MESTRKTRMRYSMAAMLALPGFGFGARIRKILSGAAYQERPKSRLIRIEQLTSVGGSHAWCESDQGRIRKPLASIPKDMKDEFFSRTI